jgi:hypothetical protein
MSILHRTAPDVQWHDLDADCPLDCRIAPAEDLQVGFPGDASDVIALVDQPEPEYLPRYRVEAIASKAMGRMLYWVVDASEGRKLSWFAVESNAADLASDLNCEDHEPLVIGGRPWWECPYPVADWDRPVKLGQPSQARADRTIDRLGLVEFPPM